MKWVWIWRHNAETYPDKSTCVSIIVFFPMCHVCLNLTIHPYVTVSVYVCKRSLILHIFSFMLFPIIYKDQQQQKWTKPKIGCISSFYGEYLLLFPLLRFLLTETDSQKQQNVKYINIQFNNYMRTVSQLESTQ